MRADAAERNHMDSTREVAKASTVKDLVLAARNALQRGLAEGQWGSGGVVGSGWIEVTTT